MQRPIYYGYYIVGAAFVAQFVAIGIYSYVLGAFMEPMLAELGWTRADFTLTRTIGQGVMAAVGVYLGTKVDRLGGRPIMLTGATILVAGLCMHTWIQSLWMWWLLNGVVVTVGCAMIGNLVVNVTLSKWFVVNRGIVVAIAAMGVSFGGIVLTPLATYLVDTIGWRQAWVVLGIGSAVLLYPVALMMRRAPEDFGLYPDGLNSQQVAAGEGDRAQTEFANSYTRAEALRTFSFYALVVAFGCFSVNIIVVLLLALPYLTDNGLSREIAAWAIAVASVPAMFSKPVWGYLIDRSPVKPLAAISASICGVSLFCIIFAVAAQEIFWIYAAFFLLGTGWGGMIPMQEVIWASFFGRRYLGSIRGAAMPYALALGAAAPWLVSYYRDVTGEYAGALLLVAGLNVASGVMIFFVPPPKQKGSAQSSAA